MGIPNPPTDLDTTNRYGERSSDAWNDGSGGDISAPTLQFGVPVFASPIGGGPIDDYVPLALGSNNWRAGVTDMLLLTPPSGGLILNGLDGLGVSTGFVMVIRNMSTADNLDFNHQQLSSASYNRFSLSGGVSARLPPLAGALMIKINDQWTFL